MTKADLVEHVAKKANLTAKAAKDAVNSVFSAITDTLKKGDKVVVTGFGTFMVRSRAARKGRNPQTGEPINIPSRKTPGFTAGKALKKSIR
ncbi:DNA-binding protein [Candidatus Gottesmanbacteria bacterium RIFCSPHIGHO2_02_FULL_40_24]|uniref:DNA-binding protein n=1 Tax=Candidatus Gottesmanbacteria bacterium RIFCSPHIGHO2_01_FULL_40_15 TaxID=1798376 RepID=A0A1F5Z7A0_9BACT|nr:MAG: DNA-binding protein [Candidatus Gottesmanbacteria bacterium RIFCSPHIGHO2_01_FULL_40_15]OGG18244.1 MAG: DNA-binding protein [Candidatus Gottesmanbacteria bacterium RIFCSPHIGHO2_02_FULL_40_24]OGG22910.1 MAG: DNA-binding protein [Candidatus Gottesmanbacteria bacterium RIFCSPLOWO2_01_FULL_40_10]OGG23528.1 MAG: DNA-binding protein [Candidatus Gottesmanbacteria bacterium RIFCSPHIGHO2_12_FULL_40_13]OGG32472.1 MAG: DNA-binding protein [Candidatus Gottesmanbacteria bacterium RIFCSPLOWO2_02_FULL_